MGKLVKDASFSIGFAPNYATNIVALTIRVSSTKKSRRGRYDT